MRGSLALASALLVLAACGGSSSETPFPLEPDLRRETSSGAPEREVVFSGRDRSDAASTEPTEEPPEEGDAQSTWGAPKKRSE